MEPAEAQRGELQPEPEPAGMSFPPPPRTKTFNAEALAKYRLTRAIYGAEPSLALLLVSLRGADKREPKCYASARGSELQFHVEDLELALAQLRNHAAAPDWQIWAVRSASVQAEICGMGAILSCARSCVWIGGEVRA
jgi:hypothetical protein